MLNDAPVLLAHHLIADRGWKTPSTYRETSQILTHERALDPALAEQMQIWAGLRNVLVTTDLRRDRLASFGHRMRNGTDQEPLPDSICCLVHCAKVSRKPGTNPRSNSPFQDTRLWPTPGKTVTA